MGKYLDPRFDLTFKNVFGRHKDLVTSFLNALIPFKEGEEIKELEYLILLSGGVLFCVFSLYICGSLFY